MKVKHKNIKNEEKTKKELKTKTYDELTRFVPDAFRTMMDETFNQLTRDGESSSLEFFAIAESVMLSANSYMLKAYMNNDQDQSNLVYRLLSNNNISHIISVRGSLLEPIDPEIEANAFDYTYYDHDNDKEIEFKANEKYHTLDQSIYVLSSRIWDSGICCVGIKDKIHNAIRQFVARDVLTAVRLDREDLKVLDIQIYIDKKMDKLSFIDRVLCRKAKEAVVHIDDVNVIIRAYK